MARSAEPRAALAAETKLVPGSSAAAFYRAKITSARFYAEHILTRSHYYLQAILAGSESVMGLDSSQF